MADEIRQDLSFDVAKALDNLKALDKSMASYESRLGQSVKAMDFFNKKGGGTVALLKKLAADGDAAARALGKVSAISGQVGSKGATSTATAPNVDQYIKRLSSMYSISEKATTAQKRSFQNAITSTAEYAAKNKVSIGQVIAQSQNLDKSFSGTANSMANRLAKLDQASKTHLNSVGQSVQKLTVDFKTMARIVTTQLIVRALSDLRNVMRGAVSSAVEFQTSVAEIGTIAPVQNLDMLAERVRTISDAFNTPLDKTAKGYYQTISNQIGSTADEFDTFVESAAKFSKVAVTDLDSAVNLGSGTLNAFGKTAAESEDTFAKFFTTIKQGRITGPELAQSLGSVSPLASKLGVELEELNSALATITIQGVAVDKATTQLRGVFNSLLKPTKEMSAGLRELGFSSGQEILQAYDLQTALRKVVGTTDGSAESVAKLIPRVRGLTGGISLVDDQAEHFTKTMQAQGDALQDVYGKANKLVTSQESFKVTKELNELTNYLTTQFGESVLEAADNMIELTGGAETLKDVLSAIGPTLPYFAAGVTTIGAALAAMAVHSKLAAVGLKGLTGPLGLLVAAPAAYSLGNYIGQSIVESWTAEQRAFDKLMKDELKSRQGKASEELRIEREKAKELQALLARQSAEANKQLFAIANEGVSGNKEHVANFRFITDAIIREATRASQEAKNRFENLGKDVLSSEQRTSKLRTQLDDSVFENRIKKQSEIKKVFALTARAGEIAAKAEQAMRKATTEGQRGGAQEDFKRAEAFAKQALSLAEGTDNAVLQQRAISAIEAITRKNISAEQTYQKTLAGSRAELANRAKVEEQRVSSLKNKQKELLKAFTLYDKKSGELLSGEDRANKLTTGHKKLQEFIQLASQGKPLDVSAMLSYANVSTQLAKEMDSFRIKELLATEASVAQLHHDIQNRLKPVYVELSSTGALKKLTGVEVTGPQSQAKATKQLAAEQNELIAVQAKYTTAGNQSAVATQTLQQRLKEVDTSAQGLGTTFAAMFAVVDNQFGFSEDANMFAGMKDALQTIRQAADGDAVSLEKLKAAAENLRNLESEQSTVSSFLTGDFKADVNEAILALGKLIQAREALKKIQAETPGQMSQDAVGARLQEINSYQQVLEKPKQDAAAMGNSLGNARAAMDGAVSPSTMLMANWQSIARSAQAAATAATNMGGPSIPMGDPRMQYHASGGPARGTDIIPAMLSAGEYVVNAKSSRQFYSQLSAINAGMKPVYRETGGSVTNIGDVSINVTETKSPKQTARDVMTAFRREMRRGSARL